MLFVGCAFDCSLVRSFVRMRACDYIQCTTLMCLFYIFYNNVESIFDWLIVFTAFFIRYKEVES